MKYFIISQPKAGTYLCSNLLVELGLNQTGMHCKGSGLFQKYDLNDPDAVTKTKQYTQRLESFDAVLNTIPDNSFAVGHLKYNKKLIESLKNVKKILVIRPFEDFDNAAKRFKQDLNRNVSASKEKYDRIKQWENENDVFVVNFYDMINKNTKKINQLQKFLFNEVVYDSKIAIQNALEKDSLTKTNFRK